MRKCFYLLLFIVIFYIFVSNLFINKISVPDDALRIRIIPNSNSDFDQDIKRSVSEKLKITLYDLLKNAESSDEARKIIKDNLDLVDYDVKAVLDNNNYNIGYDINYGYNYFPSKNYKGIKYDEGYYESLLVTLGKGDGDNYWCVLFPPLCLIEADDNTNVEYKSIVKEILNKYLF